MIRTACLSVLLCIVATGCVSGPEYRKPADPSSAALETGRFLRADGAETETPSINWWQGLNDPILAGLIEKGLQSSPTIEAAHARIRQARAGMASARAGLLPSLSGSGMYIYADLPNQAFGTPSGGEEFFTLGFDAQWEPDLWGGKRRQLEKAKADAGVAEAMLADAKVSLSAEIARSYVTLRGREASRQLLARRENIEMAMAAIADSQLSGGTGTGQQLAFARSQLAATRKEAAAVSAETVILRDALAVLTGQAPGALDDLADAPIPLPPSQVLIGDPASMLGRRPDVMAAERRLAAATAGIGVAKARRFPSISLTGLIGLGGDSIGDVVDSSQLAALAIPRLTWSFLDFGRTEAAIDAAQANRDAAEAEYRTSVLGALQDAEASLSRFGAARVAFAQSSEQAQQGKEVHRLESMRAQAGAIAQVDAMRAEQQWINGQLGKANARVQLTLSYVALTKSLGLGWNADAKR